MWTTEALNAEVDYRVNGTRDRTSRLHLHEVKRTAPAWITRVLHRKIPRSGERRTG
ncbi:hypothetical protein SAMN05192558_101167 [Actinokineospora alba]|uniref:Uncharacterized protein n=1 Tax=Actinokineospora alba TaxID=504798 RepID=A0A1H0EZV5_9PSEU|nr:hypothetical protein [Actinokineospora alba]TDP69288.1 hypothetical protein C8E96_4864 [Actinokineospora alba]SDI20135.1 hypothetical protein SAMN05421871_103702 [Actinokineospora alba]SDN87871.1 hypothetical protein SAMN05192558_101167 [Actinokineospora alba]